MNLTYTWKINNMKRNSSDGGVFSIEYTIWALDADEKRQQGLSGKVELEPNPNSDSFVEYENLTKDLVMTWVHEAINKTEKEEELKQLWIKMFPSASEEPSTISQGTPWDLAEQE